MTGVEVKRLTIVLIAAVACVLGPAASVAAASGPTSGVQPAITPTAPYITAAFPYAGIPLDNAAQGPFENPANVLTFALTNSNLATTLTGVGFSMHLPLGTHVGNYKTTVCGGNLVTAAPVGIVFSGGTITFSGGTLGARTTCKVYVNVLGWSVGHYTLTTSAVTSTQNPSGGKATVGISVDAGPVIADAFSPASITLGQTTSLNFTITNPKGNTTALTTVGFVTVMPAALTVASAKKSLCGGTLEITAPGTIAIWGPVKIAVGSKCAFSVTITGHAVGSYSNTTGIVSASEGGNGNAATATVTVGPAPTPKPAVPVAATPTIIGVDASSTVLPSASGPAATVTASPTGSPSATQSVGSATPLGPAAPTAGSDGTPLMLLAIAGIVVLAFGGGILTALWFRRSGPGARPGTGPAAKDV
jgi:hypothetical protein